MNQDLNPSSSISLQPFQKVADISECPYLKEDKHSQRPDYYRWFHGNLAEGKKPHYCCKLEKNAWYNRVPRTKMCSESDSRSFDFSRMRRTGFSFNSGGLESCSPQRCSSDRNCSETVRKRSQVPTTRSISCSIGRRSISVIRTTCWRSISSQIACYFVGAILSKRFNARGSFSRGRRIVFCNFLAGAALILWCGQDAVFLNRRGRAAPTRHSVKSRGSSEFFANCFGLLGLSVALGVLAFVVLFFFSFLSPSASACFCSWSWFFFLEGLWPWEEPTLKMTEDALGVPAVVALSFFFFSFFLCFCSWSSCCSCKECGR